MVRDVGGVAEKRGLAVWSALKSRNRWISIHIFSANGKFKHIDLKEKN